MTILVTATERLKSGADSIMVEPTVTPGSAQDIEHFLRVFHFSTDPTEMLYEPFDGGWIAEMDRGDGETFYVAVGTDDIVTALVVSRDQMEADALYAGIAEETGTLNGRCGSCGARIASVYEYCRDCA